MATNTSSNTTSVHAAMLPESKELRGMEVQYWNGTIFYTILLALLPWRTSTELRMLHRSAIGRSLTFINKSASSKSVSGRHSVYLSLIEVHGVLGN